MRTGVLYRRLPQMQRRHRHGQGRAGPGPGAGLGAVAEFTHTGVGPPREEAQERPTDSSYETADTRGRKAEMSRVEYTQESLRDVLMMRCKELRLIPMLVE